jgi:glycosyltransferase involved in cell wall biosynthesis
VRKPRNKIALVANTSWSIYNFRLEIARHLSSLNAEVFIIAPRDKHSEKLISEGFYFIDAPIKSYSNNPFDDFRYFSFLYRKYSKIQFTHIFHYTIKANIYGSLAARMLGIQSTAIVTGMGRLFRLKKGVKKSLMFLLYKIGCFAANFVWFLNEEDKSFFLTNRIVSKIKVGLLPSEGINLHKYFPKQEKDFSTTVFLFAGRLLLEKGIFVFLKAAERVKGYNPNVHFSVLGFIDQSDNNSIDQEMILDFQKRGIITFYGDSENVKPFIEQATCVVLPSVYGEGVSKILMEAAAMKTPIITSRNRGCSEVVVDGYNGFLCEGNNVDSLVDQMLAFISLDVRAKKIMGENGRKHVNKKYDVSDVKKRYASHLGLFADTNARAHSVHR